MMRLPEQDLLPMILVGNGTVGGVEESVLGTTSYLHRLGYPVLVAVPYCGDFSGALLERGLPPENLYVLEMPDHLSIAALAELVHIINARGVTFLHGHLPRAGNLVAAAGAHTGIPAVATLHGMTATVHDLLLHRLYGLKYIAVSEATRDAAVARGIAGESVTVITNGVDTGRFDPTWFDRSAQREQLGIRDEEVLVTCIARLSWEKYPEGLVRAASIALLREQRLRFAFVGSGPLTFKLRQLAACYAHGRIRLLGLRRDMPEVLAATDIAALTSLSEGLPFAVLEAMAMARPVIAHDVGGLSELIEDSLDGFLVAPGDAEQFAGRLVELAADNSLREQIGSAGRQKVLNRFHSDTSNALMLSLYRTESRASIAVTSAARA